MKIIEPNKPLLKYHYRRDFNPIGSAVPLIAMALAATCILRILGVV